jgi:hypothetical protein
MMDFFLEKFGQKKRQLIMLSLDLKYEFVQLVFRPSCNNRETFPIQIFIRQC